MRRKMQSAEEESVEVCFTVISTCFRTDDGNRTSDSGHAGLALHAGLLPAHVTA